MVGLGLMLACAGCSADPTEEPEASGTPTVTVAPTTPPAVKTVELRYTVTPRKDSLLRITLPPQQPGGTLISWSAYFQGVGTVGTPGDPLKVECYVVQATGPDFEDRVFYVADDSTVSTGDDVSVSGTGLVDTADGEELTFECELDENVEPTIAGEWQTFPQQPIQVTLTPVASERQEVTVK